MKIHLSEIKEKLNRLIKPTTERSLIGLLLKNNENIIEIQDKGITDAMFLIEANRYIYQSMDYLFHKKQEITPTAIMEVMKDTHMKKVVADYGGLEYLTILSASSRLIEYLSHSSSVITTDFI